MIDKIELMAFSRQFGLRASVVEKDYVLGWVLAGIFHHKEIGDAWVFKGGTCLKKCYIDTYRFSEDLDFTLIKGAALDQDLLTQWFEQISDWVYYESGIELPKAFIRFDVYKNHRGGLSAQGKIAYKGPLRPGGDLPRIKLDLTLDEILVMPPVIKAVDHPYSDIPDHGIQINAYAFQEIFAEKIRALAERERPRDLYDVVSLYQQYGKNVDLDCFTRVLKKKCVFKRIDFPTMENLKNRTERQELEAEWRNMLAHQMTNLPEFDYFWKEIETVMTWLNRD